MARRWWEDRDLWIGVAGFGALVGGLQLAGFNPVGQITAAAGDAGFMVTDVFARGDQLSFGTLGPDGVVVDDPETLRLAASSRYGSDIDKNVYALARMVRSEGAKQGNYRVHVALNDLAALGWPDAFTLITYSTNAAKKGKYGEQATRRYASPKDPYTGDVQTVLQAIDQHDSGFDPTGGATKFVDKDSFGVQAGTGSYEDLVARWAPDGLIPYNMPDVTSNLVFFKKGGVPDGGTPA